MKRKRSPLFVVGVLLLSLAVTQIASASANWFVVETKESDPDCECAWARFRHDDGREYEACCLEVDCGGIIPSIGQEYKEDFSGDGIILVPTGEDKPPGLQRFKVIEEEPPPSPEPTSTPTPTDTPTPTSTFTPTPTDTPTPTPTPTPTSTPTPTPTPTPTLTPTNTPVPPTDTPLPPTEAAPPGFGFGPDTIADVQPRYANTESGSGSWVAVLAFVASAAVFSGIAMKRRR